MVALKHICELRSIVPNSCSLTTEPSAQSTDMAEPLSVLASVAGVATAGVAISKMIYEIAHTVKHAPKEVSEMAGELSLLSSVMRYLRSALAEYIDVCKPRLIKDIRGTVSKIHDLHRQIKDVTKNSTSSFYRVELLFKSPKTKNLLAQIEGFKNSVSVMLTTVQLAAAKKQLKMYVSFIPTQRLELERANATRTDLRSWLQRPTLVRFDSCLRTCSSPIKTPLNGFGGSKH